MGATAGLSSSADRIFREQHCWTSQQWHPWRHLLILNSFFIRDSLIPNFRPLSLYLGKPPDPIPYRLYPLGALRISSKWPLERTGSLGILYQVHVSVYGAKEFYNFAVLIGAR